MGAVAPRSGRGRYWQPWRLFPAQEGVSMAQVALSWLRDRPTVSSVILGWPDAAAAR